MPEIIEFIPSIIQEGGPRKRGEGLGQTDKAREKAREQLELEGMPPKPPRKTPNTLARRAIAYAKEHPVVTNDPKFWFKAGYRDAEQAHLRFTTVSVVAGENDAAYKAGMGDFEAQSIAKAERMARK